MRVTEGGSAGVVAASPLLPPSLPSLSALPGAGCCIYTPFRSFLTSHGFPEMEMEPSVQRGPTEV